MNNALLNPAALRPNNWETAQTLKQENIGTHWSALPRKRQDAELERLVRAMYVDKMNGIYYGVTSSEILDRPEIIQKFSNNLSDFLSTQPELMNRQIDAYRYAHVIGYNVPNFSYAFRKVMVLSHSGENHYPFIESLIAVDEAKGKSIHITCNDETIPYSKRRRIRKKAFEEALLVGGTIKDADRGGLDNIIVTNLEQETLTHIDLEYAGKDKAEDVFSYIMAMYDITEYDVDWKNICQKYDALQKRLTCKKEANLISKPDYAYYTANITECRTYANEMAFLY